MSSVAGPRRTRVDAERITEAALELVDADGLERLSMRRLARQLGVPVMTLYGHVATKDEVLDRLAERALEELELPCDDLPWDEQLAQLFRSLREVFLRHRGLALLFADRAVSGPAAYRAANAVLGILGSAGMAPDEAVAAFTALFTYTLGATLFTIARSPEAPDDAERRRLDRLQAASPEQLPALVQAREHMQVRGTQAQFDYGLTHLLDGLRRGPRR